MDWAAILTAASLVIVALTGLYTARTARIAAAVSRATLHQVSPPSNGQTLGRLVESVVVTAGAAAVDSARSRQAVLSEATGLGAIHGVVEATRSEVITSNGIAMGLLAERAEGRRVEADVPHADRTPSEQGYVDRLHGPEDAEGDPPPVEP